MNEDEEICCNCNGSGEGMYDGSRCSSCKGSGVETDRDTAYENACEKADYDYDQARERQYDLEWESRNV